MAKKEVKKKEVPNYITRWEKDNVHDTLDRVRAYYEGITSLMEEHSNKLYNDIADAIKAHTKSELPDFRYLSRQAFDGKGKVMFDDKLAKKVEAIMEKAVSLNSDYSRFKNKLKDLTAEDEALLAPTYMPDLRDLKKIIGSHRFESELKSTLQMNQRRVAQEDLSKMVAGLDSSTHGESLTDAVLSKLGLKADQVYHERMRAESPRLVSMYVQGQSAEEFISTYHPSQRKPEKKKEKAYKS